MARRRTIGIAGASLLLVAIAVVVLLVVLSENAGGGGGEDPGAKQAAARECHDQQAPPLSTAPAHAIYRPLTRGQRVGLGQTFSGSGVPADLVDGRRVTIKTGQSTGVLVVNRTVVILAVPGAGSNDALHEDFESGFRGASQQQGLTLAERQLADQTVLIAHRFGITYLVGTSGCYGIAVFASHLHEVESLGAAMIAEADE